VRVVVADTGPINYLLLIDAIELLPRLFQTVRIPQLVCAELASAGAPALVRDWVAMPPDWLSIEPTPPIASPSPKLDAGEEAALALAIALRATLLLIDDRAGVSAARAHGFEVAGTLGVLQRASLAGFVDLRAALTRLAATNFHIRPELIEALLKS
jgi:predicted nucleic acid-binding protein